MQPRQRGYFENFDDQPPSPRYFPASLALLYQNAKKKKRPGKTNNGPGRKINTLIYGLVKKQLSIILDMAQVANKILQFMSL